MVCQRQNGPQVERMPTYCIAYCNSGCEWISARVLIHSSLIKPDACGRRQSYSCGVKLCPSVTRLSKLITLIPGGLIKTFLWVSGKQLYRWDCREPAGDLVAQFLPTIPIVWYSFIHSFHLFDSLFLDSLDPGPSPWPCLHLLLLPWSFSMNPTSHYYLLVLILSSSWSLNGVSRWRQAWALDVWTWLKSFNLSILFTFSHSFLMGNLFFESWESFTFCGDIE